MARAGTSAFLHQSRYFLTSLNLPFSYNSSYWTQKKVFMTKSSNTDLENLREKFIKKFRIWEGIIKADINGFMQRNICIKMHERKWKYNYLSVDEFQHTGKLSLLDRQKIQFKPAKVGLNWNFVEKSYFMYPDSEDGLP